MSWNTWAINTPVVLDRAIESAGNVDVIVIGVGKDRKSPQGQKSSFSRVLKQFENILDFKGTSGDLFLGYNVAGIRYQTAKSSLLIFLFNATFSSELRSYVIQLLVLREFCWLDWVIVIAHLLQVCSNNNYSLFSISIPYGDRISLSNGGLALRFAERFSSAWIYFVQIPRDRYCFVCWEWIAIKRIRFIVVLLLQDWPKKSEKLPQKLPNSWEIRDAQGKDILQSPSQFE